jgi:hypothetical protein
MTRSGGRNQVVEWRGCIRGPSGSRVDGYRGDRLLYEQHPAPAIAGIGAGWWPSDGGIPSLTIRRRLVGDKRRPGQRFDRGIFGPGVSGPVATVERDRIRVGEVTRR